MDFSDQTIVELQSLLDLANDGDSDAFSQMVFRAEGRLRGLVQRMLRRYPQVRRWEQTDDVYQKSLIRLHRALAATRPESVRGMVGLTATQIRRTLIDLARHYYGTYGQGAKHHTDGQGRAADDPGGPLEQSDRNQGEPETLDDWTAFHLATQQLPKDEQEVFNLVWYAGLEQKDVANLVNISVRTVIRRMNRARLHLKELLATPPSPIDIHG